jgi:hypothetical protein
MGGHSTGVSTLDYGKPLRTHHIANVIEHFTQGIGAMRYILCLLDHRGPVGFAWRSRIQSASVNGSLRTLLCITHQSVI